MSMLKKAVTETGREGRAEETFLVGRETGAIPILSAPPHRRASVTLGKRWGVILAGGDGTRLQRLTRLICGDDRPKQFCALVGNETLLEQTRQRAERSILPGQILVPLTRRPNLRPSRSTVLRLLNQCRNRRR